MFYKYYAVVDFGMGSGSYGNGHTQKEAIDNCKYHLATDWGMRKGAEIVVNLFERKQDKEPVFKEYIDTTV